MIDWDDIRVFLAIERSGTVRGAARELGVTHATVARRIGKLEADLETQLFERLPNGQRPTQAAAAITQTAHKIDAMVARLAREVYALDQQASGIVRVSMPESLAARLVTPRLPEFCERFPEVELELSLTNALLSLTHRETDIAVRLGQQPPEDVIARKLASSPLCVFAARDYLDAPPARDRWVNLDYPPAAALAPDAPASATISGLLAMVHALENGLGRGVLPCFLGDHSALLRRVPGAQPVADLSLWLLIHPDVRQVRRVREVSAFLVELFATHRDVIEGRRPFPPS